MFSFLNTRSDFLTVTVVSTLLATPSAALDGELVVYVVGQLRDMFSEDWQDNHKRFVASVALSGVRLRVEVWVIGVTCNAYGKSRRISGGHLRAGSFV